MFVLFVFGLFSEGKKKGVIALYILGLNISIFMVQGGL